MYGHYAWKYCTIYSGAAWWVSKSSKIYDPPGLMFSVIFVFRTYGRAEYVKLMTTPVRAGAWWVKREFFLTKMFLLFGSAVGLANHFSCKEKYRPHIFPSPPFPLLFAFPSLSWPFRCSHTHISKVLQNVHTRNEKKKQWAGKIRTKANNITLYFSFCLSIHLIYLSFLIKKNRDIILSFAYRMSN